MRTLKFISVAIAFASSAYGQGDFIFDNAVGIPGKAYVTRFEDGRYVGSDYTASLFYLNGNPLASSVTNSVFFFSLNPIYDPGASTPFFGTTGGGPTIDGAGIVEYPGGVYFLSRATSTIVTMLMGVWFNGGGATSFSQALAQGAPTALSNPVVVTLVPHAGLMPPNAMDGLLPFTVGTPEPSVLALVSLGAAILVLLERRR